MKVIRLKYKDKNWNKIISFSENSSWIAGKHLANLMIKNQFTDWESVFIAIDNENICGYCTFLKEDYYP